MVAPQVVEDRRSCRRESAGLERRPRPRSAGPRCRRPATTVSWRSGYLSRIELGRGPIQADVLRSSKGTRGSSAVRYGSPTPRLLDPNERPETRRWSRRWRSRSGAGAGARTCSVKYWNSVGHRRHRGGRLGEMSQVQQGAALADRREVGDAMSGSSATTPGWASAASNRATRRLRSRPWSAARRRRRVAVEPAERHPGAEVLPEVDVGESCQAQHLGDPASVSGSRRDCCSAAAAFSAAARARWSRKYSRTGSGCSRHPPLVELLVDGRNVERRTRRP